MKKILFAICVLLLWGCKKEDVLTSEIDFENIYTIEDDATDPIRHRIYTIYKEYNVPVYFNDTISRVIVGQDKEGKPVYKYEKLDLEWTFSSYAKFKYDFEYMTDPVEQTKALDIIEEYLASSSAALYPFCFFVTQSGVKIDQGKVIEELSNGKFEIGFRAIYMTGNWTAALTKTLPAEMMRQMVRDKILNYPEEIAVFGAVSTASWYGGKYWTDIDPSIPHPLTAANALYDDWLGAKWYTQVELGAMRVHARSVIGRFGFVRGNVLTEGLETPKDANDDLRGYITEMLLRTPEEFKELWGASPLVMKKYGILSDVIVNKMGVQL